MLIYGATSSGEMLLPVAAMFLLFMFFACIYAIAAIFVWLRDKWHKSRPSIHATPPDSSWNSRPRPGQICWADVPFADRSGSKVRPCLVIRTHERAIEVFKITSQDKSDRYDCMRIPTARWDKRARKDSWLDLGRTYFIGDQDVRRVAGSCDAETWSFVTERHDAGWVYIPRPDIDA